MGQLQSGYGLQDEFFAVSREKALSLSNTMHFAFTITENRKIIAE